MAFRVDMVFTVLVTGRCLLPVCEIPKPWVLDPDIHMLPTSTPTMGSLDPVEIGKGGQSMGSHGRAHEDIFPMSTLCRRLARKESALSSGVSGMVSASIGAAVSVILGDAGKTSYAAAGNAVAKNFSADAATAKSVDPIAAVADTGGIEDIQGMDLQCSDSVRSDMGVRTCSACHGLGLWVWSSHRSEPTQFRASGFEC